MEGAQRWCYRCLFTGSRISTNSLLHTMSWDLPSHGLETWRNHKDQTWMLWPSRRSFRVVQVSVRVSGGTRTSKVLVRPMLLAMEAKWLHRGHDSRPCRWFSFAGPADNPEWQEIEKKIQHKYRWTDWEENSFVQCGVLIEAQKDGSFFLSQPKYLDKVSEISLSAARRKDANAPTSEKEKSLLRAVLGALSWYAQQVASHFSAEVGLLLSDVTVSSVETIHQTNKLLQKAKSRKDHKLVIHAHPEETPLGMFCWADAAGQNRRDGGSTQGIFVGVAPMNLLKGGMERITPISWHAGKIDRVTRSPGAAEARAVVNGEDVLFHARFQYGEMLHNNPNVFDVNELVNVVPGCIVSDSRNVYDKLQSEELSPKGAERRTDIELLALKAAQKRNNVVVRWVHSEAQLGNALTKAGAKELDLFYTMKGMWRIVEDDGMRSARKRRSTNTPLFENNTQGTPVTPDDGESFYGSHFSFEHHSEEWRGHAIVMSIQLSRTHGFHRAYDSLHLGSRKKDLSEVASPPLRFAIFTWFRIADTWALQLSTSGTIHTWMLYMVTFTINIPQMLAYIPYMDPMGMLNYGYPLRLLRHIPTPPISPRPRWARRSGPVRPIPNSAGWGGCTPGAWPVSCNLDLYMFITSFKII